MQENAINDCQSSLAVRFLRYESNWDCGQSNKRKKRDSIAVSLFVDWLSLTNNNLMMRRAGLSRKTCLWKQTKVRWQHFRCVEQLKSMQGKYLVTTEKIIFMRFENSGLKSIEKEISLKPTFMPMPLDIVIHTHPFSYKRLYNTLYKI